MEDKEIKLEIYINKISVNNFNLNIPDGKKINTEIKNLFEFRYNIETNINPERGIIIVNLELLILYEKEIICSLKTTYEYVVKNLKHIATKENNSIKIPIEIPRELIANSISTTRGIIFLKTAGTPIESIYLPLVKSNDIVASN